MRNMYEANKYGWRQISNYRCEYPMCGSRIFFSSWGGGPRDHCVCTE